MTGLSGVAVIVVTRNVKEKVLVMALILLALLVVLVLFGLGFTLHVLWWIALIALIVWLLGFVLRAGSTIARPRRRRWYYW